jgi:ABC-type nickel/cobalt efflux system permease component RcnA
LLASKISAHPMGNFSINHYSAIRIGQREIQLDYVIDMAEIPTFQEMRQGEFPADPQDARVKAYVTARAVELARGLELMAGGSVLHLHMVSDRVTFLPGAGNLPTLRMKFLGRAVISEKQHCNPCELTYKDLNFSGRAGWKEIIATAGPGVSIRSSTAPEQDRSAELANYSSDLLNSPPQDLEARVSFSLGRPAPLIAHAVTRGQVGNGKSDKQELLSSAKRDATTALPRVSGPAAIATGVGTNPSRSATPRNAFTELMNKRQIDLRHILFAAFIAVGLGALHALEPGHGKTIVAAYLVGSRGTAQHAFLLGIIVTISHTAGVYLLGAITIYAQKYILPERIYPFLAVLSGVFIAGMGLYLVLQRLRGDGVVHSHSHSHGGHQHSHGEHQHSHGGHQHSHGAHQHPHGGLWHSHDHHAEHAHHEVEMAARTGSVSGRQLFLLGITGGMIPCPAALVVLLSAAALHRVGFGLFLIVCFSVGLAAVLITMGLMAIYAGRLLKRLPMEGPLIQRWLPTASAAIITMIGCVITVKSLIAAGVFQGKI